MATTRRWMLGSVLAAGLLALPACAPGRDRSAGDAVVLQFWAMGSEGEKTQPLIDEFEAAHPNIRIEMQQIPWTAAHEKLLTAFAGDTLPDVCQLGNTWIPEFVALNSLEDLSSRIAASTAIEPADYFAGAWRSNIVEGRQYGVPWYVDTRVIFYRTDMLAAAGHDRPPRSWDEWLQVMRDVQARQPAGSYAVLLPVNEFEQPVILGLQTGGDMLKEDGRYGNFSGANFRRAFEFYVRIFREGLAPKLPNTQISNVWQEFARGTFAMYITGPWNVNEFRRRLPKDFDAKWSTAPWPSPDGDGYGTSYAGGSSLVMFADSPQKEAAWKFIEFMAQPRQQVRLLELTGNLPPGEKAWAASGMLDDPKFVGFHEQLTNVAPAPPAPEWEQIVTGELVKTAEAVINDRAGVDEALAELDRKVDGILAKRRWMLARRAEDPAAAR
ncbi:MAG: ABC transporter substrate-binding protein [Planctomycetota bacterium]|nr:MAG: ABC transporter substrate-binding protein [Planctomycetota bacterium]